MVNPEDKKARVSVIIPNYCNAHTIDRAVNSVLAQTLLPKELILIDDASPDNGRTISALEAIKEKCSELILINIIALPENKGAANARNVGWAAATQPYIAFLDADDGWHPEKLRIQYNYMHSHTEVVMTGHLYVLLPNAETLAADYDIQKISKIGLCVKKKFSTPTVMLKRDIPFRFTEKKRYGEDLDLWLQIAFNNEPIELICLPLAYLYKGPYGDGGLSAELWNMEKGELDCFSRLYRNNKINLLALGVVALYSFAKYIRRFLITRWKTFLLSRD